MLFISHRERACFSGYFFTLPYDCLSFLAANFKKKKILIVVASIFADLESESHVRKLATL